MDRLLGGLFFALGDFGAGFLIDHLHAEPDLAAIVEAEQFHFHLVAFLDDVGDLGDALGGELGVGVIAASTANPAFTPNSHQG